MLKSTISEIKTNVEEIYNLVLSSKPMEAFEKFYSEDTIMVQANDWTATDKAEFRKIKPT